MSCPAIAPDGFWLSGQYLAGACSCAGSVERREGAVFSAQEAVNHTARVKIRYYDRPRRVDTYGLSALTGPCAAAGASKVIIVGLGAIRACAAN